MNSTTTPTPRDRDVVAPATRRAGRSLGFVLVIVGMVLIVTLLVAILLKGPAAPKNDAAALAKIASSAEFQNAPPEKQRQYMVSMNDRSDQIVAAYKAGKLSDEEYRTAMNAGWMAKQEEHMAKYHALPAGKAREDYLDHLTEKHEIKKTREKLNPELASDFKHDVAYEENYIAKWPAEKRAQYEAFRRALVDRRHAYETTHGKPKKPGK
ncbi:hypothetical protein BH09PLA1_BH09PLA1_25790 [soil metagenome]